MIAALMPPDIGKVTSHAITMLRKMDQSTFSRARNRPTNTTDPTLQCVVLMGMPTLEATSTVSAEPISIQKPLQRTTTVVSTKANQHNAPLSQTYQGYLLQQLALREHHLPPLRIWSINRSEISAQISPKKPTWPQFTKFSVHVASGCGMMNTVCYALLASQTTSRCLSHNGNIQYTVGHKACALMSD